MPRIASGLPRHLNNQGEERVCMDFYSHFKEENFVKDKVNFNIKLKVYLPKKHCKNAFLNSAITF